MKTATRIGTRHGAGFTLVELMVALVIGLVLVLVIAQLFLGSRRTFGTTDDISRMQENIRFSSLVLTRMIHQAGYRTSPNTQSSFIFQAPDIMIEAVPGVGQASDKLTVRFQGNGVAGMPVTDDRIVLNCRGERVLAGIMSVNEFTVENVSKTDGGVVVQVPTLVCHTNTDGFAGAHTIVPDVDNMRILYGEDTNGDAIVDRYVPFASVADINNVIVLRIALLFRSANSTTATQKSVDQFYTLNGASIGPFNDARARRDVVFTAGIRNRSP